MQSPISLAPSLVFHSYFTFPVGHQALGTGLAGNTIPAGSRLLAIAIAYIVMINGRPYQPSRSSAEALAELQRCAGTQFDPEMVDALVNLPGQKQDQKLAELAHLT